jgi:Fe-S cluster assembly protein SufD
MWQVDLNGPHASSEVDGLALAKGSQLSDLHSTLAHNSRDCSSRQEQRNAAAGRGRVVFRGAVLVPLGADNTTAHQLCRSLLLSDSARADISPQLQIDTDEVVCTHGATIADLDDEMIFYLQVRRDRG